MNRDGATPPSSLTYAQVIPTALRWGFILAGLYLTVFVVWSPYGMPWWVRLIFVPIIAAYAWLLGFDYCTRRANGKA